MITSGSARPTDLEASTLRKIQARIIPFVFVLMVIAFLDRINIGFAAFTMNKDLVITSQQFGFLSGIFFWGYFIFEIPWNLALPNALVSATATGPCCRFVLDRNSCS